MPLSERCWHISGHDETGEGWYSDYWTDEEAAARNASNAGNSVVEYVRADLCRGAVSAWAEPDVDRIYRRLDGGAFGTTSKDTIRAVLHAGWPVDA